MASRNLARVLAASALCGTRTLAVPALISRIDAVHSNDSRVADLLHSRRTARWLPLVAAGEIVADKFPVPDRISPPALAARAASGAIVALALVSGRSSARTRWLAAGLGALAAVGAAHATFRLRRAANQKLHIPSPALGAIEDAAIIAAGATLLRTA